MEPRDNLLDKLTKLTQRADWREPCKVPSGQCTDVTTHLAGMFLKAHAGAIVEALRRMD